MIETNDTISLPFLTSPDRDPSWRDLAMCRTTPTHWFYESQHINAVKVLCSECPSRMECCDFAVRNSITHGLWGGLTHKERKEIMQ